LPVATFTAAASADLIEAQDWYEAKAPGLGAKFLAAIDTLVSRIVANSRQFPVVHKNVRRALSHRFPYALFFVEEGETLLVIACMHGRRDPSQWQRRM